MAKLVAAGRLPVDKLESSYNAWQNHTSHGNCYDLAKSMDKKIMQILRRNGKNERR